MKSKNIVFTAAKQVALISESVERPKGGEMLCKAEKSLISVGTETTCLGGVFDPCTSWADWVQYPFHTGYSMAATVLEIGDEVKGFAVGDQVYVEAEHRQYFICNESSAVKIPEGLSLEEATWTALARVAQNAIRKGQVMMGDTVAVIGAGQIGQLAVQFAKISGAGQVLTIDSMKSRTDMAMESGATLAINKNAIEAIEDIKALTNGKMVDIACDATGHPSVLAPSCEMVRKFGKVVLVGDVAQPTKQALGVGVVSNSLSILAAHGSMYASEENPYYPFTWKSINSTSMQFMVQKRLNVRHLITHIASPEEAPEIFERLLTDRSFAMGIVFDWSQLK